MESVYVQQTGWQIALLAHSINICLIMIINVEISFNSPGASTKI